MANYTLPDTVHGGSVTVSGNSLADAQKNAASQTGASLAQQQGGGTFGVNTNPSVGSSGGGSPAASPQQAQTGANLAAGQLLLQQAQQAAYQAYLDAKLKLDTDQNAWQKAAQQAATTIAEAGVTGTYMGQPTQQAVKQAADIAQQQAATMLSYATTFGVWGTPQQGQQTMAAQQQAAQQAQDVAKLTGWYQAPSYSPVPPINPPTPGGNIAIDAFNNRATPEQRQQYLTMYGQGLPTAAALNQAAGHFWNDTMPSINASGQTAEQYVYGTPAQTTQPGAPGAGGPVQTLAGSEQAYTQWLRSQQQALADWTAKQTASQNYLTLLSNLRGPADWAQYQKVLGATPGGTQDLVRAAAGQYIPGGGATTGVQPQAADLNTLYNQATGGNASGQSALTSMQNTLVAPNQMAPQTWNALQPSQQQMLLGVWESQGYSKEDAQNLFNQSLPKYATAAGAGGTGGQFKLQ